jgi:REP element-mobilizing transposase RayT
MARKPRIQFKGAFYHVIVRGNQKQSIFLDDADRNRYLEGLAKYKRRCKFVLYAYVLMDNHVHLLIETPEEPISRIMQLINFTYTQYFNKKYGKEGHLFQGRYKAILCDRDSYLLSLVRYIHRNPVKAGIATSVAEYQWSGNNEYYKENPELVDTDGVLRMFSEKPSVARRKFREFIEEKPDEELPYTVKDQQVAGGERFLEKIAKKTEEYEIPAKKPKYDNLIKAVRSATGVEIAEIISKSRAEGVKNARSVLITLARESGYKLKELQEKLKRDDTVICRIAGEGKTEERQRLLKKARRELYAISQA